MRSSKMAANQKYQPVPTQDNVEEEGPYNHPPPSYQTEAAPGQARVEDDNLPDDFKVSLTAVLDSLSTLLIGLSRGKFGGSVAEATLPIRMQFVRKVYAILTLQLFLTTGLSAVSFVSPSYKSWIQSNQWMLWVSLFGAIGMMCKCRKMGGHGARG